ncbi:translation initiation factor eIF2 alpha subunit [Reticulomyxa filosa]|uniref:Translation initiation factor eIF2 alpha subunit n=1 Tax=Reticulomyxa filosa TaxID=46433 RepID=X6NT57_RETFI|nr:translation initiation factor eIF2 alpha subunit [Reticulomyxa filosa]|eukprot:ETO29455.1 translation initiation factor eIF2 alpha subunit [Reticulomyxa filosa]
MSRAKKSLDCRMYKKEYPDVGDLVVVEVKAIESFGALCSLLEYNKIEGMVVMSELSFRRVKSVGRVLQVGKQEIMAVIAVNSQKGYIDLSKNRVEMSAVRQCEENWNKSKAVHSIMRHVAKHSEYGVEQLYQQFGWPMAQKYGHAYDGFKFALEHKEEFLKEFDVPESIREMLFARIENRLKPQVVSVEAVIDVTCFGDEGILAMKKAFKTGLETHSDDDFSIKITLESPPSYKVSIKTLKPEAGEKALYELVNTIGKCLAECQGNVKIKSKPNVVSQDDDDNS